MDRSERLSGLFAVRAALRKFAERFRVPIVLTAIGAFSLLFILSAADLSLDPAGMRWSWLIWAAATVPLAMFANALELALCARATGRAMPVETAFICSAAATIANVLPLPAGLLVRAKALVGAGAGWIESGKILAAAGLLWLAMATACVGFALAPSPRGTLALVAGTLGCVAIARWTAQRAGQSTSAGFLLVRGAMLGLLALRLYFCFQAIGQPVSLQDSANFMLAGVLGNSVVVVPSGLGIAEGIGAAMAGLVSVLPAAAFLALGINRLLGLAGSALVVGAHLLLARGKRPATAGRAG
ncbi:MAG TPA: hypothetical protein VGN60_11435 [Devosia sp.]|jgi:uncharacterized membrane protein YbhN (UPF0104 family)|nr:hypothetical protein [Devosia sp.]